MLQRIEFARKIFIMNIELGLEVLIPKLLSMDSLPLSYRFYDPIQAIVRELMSEERKEIFQMKNNFNLQRIAESDGLLIVLRKFKIYDENAEEKLTFQPHQINELEK